EAGSNNTVDYSGTTAAAAADGVTVALGSPGSAAPRSGSGLTNNVGSDTLRNFSNVIGSNFADKLTTSGPGQTLNGGTGDDELDAGTTDAATLNGGDGNDTLHGGGGPDRASG